MKTHRLRPDRSVVDLEEGAIARSWSKQFGKPIEEIAAAIRKVGNNAQAVKKELQRAKASIEQK
jgi:hypothetical protein